MFLFFFDIFKAASPQRTNWTRFQSFVRSFCIESIVTNLHHESNMVMWSYGWVKRKGLCKLTFHLCTIDNSYACKWLTLLISSFQTVLQLFAMFSSVSSRLGYEGVSFWRPLRILRCQKGWQKTWRIRYEQWRQWSLNWAEYHFYQGNPINLHYRLSQCLGRTQHISVIKHCKM